MGYPEIVRHARGTVAILAVGAVALAVVGGCARSKKAPKGGTPTVSSVDPVEVAEQASAAPLASAGFEAFHRAFTLHDTACAGGAFNQCVDLGIDYETGRGVAPDPAKAAPLYETGCNHSVFAGCTNLGQLTDR